MINTLLKHLTNYFMPKEKNNKSVISSYTQIEDIIKLNFPKLLIFLYNNKEKIHEILYDNDMLLKLPSTLTDKGIPNLFFIVLLIKSDPSVLNYTYELDFIKKVNNLKINSNKGTLTIFILSLILIQLINNYKSTDVCSCEEDSFLDKVYEECKNIKNDHENIFKNMNLNISDKNVEENSLEEIYIEIIKSLINNRKLDNYDYCSNILGQIDLDKIELTEKMYNELLNVFNNENVCKYINEYYISEVEDLLDEKKLDFYLTIFNYILKESIYIYNFNFLLKVRNEVLKIIKSEDNFKLSEAMKNKKIKEKLYFILNKFCDNNYYINNYINNIYIQLNEVLQYYKDFYFFSKEKEIINIENYLNNKITLSKSEKKEYLQDYVQAEQLKKFRDIIYFFLEERDSNFFDKKGNLKDKNEKTQNEVDKYIKKIESCVKMFEDNKFEKKMRKDDIITIYNYYTNDKKDEEKKSKIIPDNLSESFMNHAKKMMQIDEEWDKSCNNNNLMKHMDDKINKIKNIDENSTDDTETKKEPNKIISPIKTLKGEPQLKIIQTENGEIIGMNQDSLEIFNIELEKIKVISEKNGLASNIEYTPKYESDKPTDAEEKENKENKDMEIITIKGNEISKMKINKTKGITQKDSIKLNKLTPNSSLTLDNINQLIFCKEGAYHYKNLFGDIQFFDTKKISDDNCIGGIKLNKNLIAFTSHIDSHRGTATDKITFYNPSTNEIVQEIEGYYINNVLNNYGLSVLTPSDNNINDNKILLVACKKYESRRRKNGILLININNIKKYNGDDNENFIKFIETGEFEAYTFCQLKTKSNILTDYFLVGGYNEEGKKGEIKLYKNLLNKNKNELDIKFIATLEPENSNNNGLIEFNGIIKCIIQSINKKNIIIYSDENIHIFSQPDFRFDEELINTNEDDDDEDKDVDWKFLGALSSS